MQCYFLQNPAKVLHFTHSKFETIKMTHRPRQLALWPFLLSSASLFSRLQPHWPLCSSQNLLNTLLWAFAPTAPSAWTALPPDGYMIGFLTSFHSLLSFTIKHTLVIPFYSASRPFLSSTLYLRGANPYRLHSQVPRSATLGQREPRNLTEIGW